MYILTKEMRDEFVAGLSANFPYAGFLPNKSLDVKGDIIFAASHLYAYGTPFWTRGGQKHLKSCDIPLINAILSNFAQEIYNYFHSNAPKSQYDFNEFHKKMVILRKWLIFCLNIWRVSKMPQNMISGLNTATWLLTDLLIAGIDCHFTKA